MQDDEILPSGTRLGQPDGRYELFGLVGSGGMGRVYEGLDRKLLRTVAVKVLRRSPQANAKAIERLFREARAAQLTEHEGVVQVYGAETDEPSGRAFIVMERLQGEDLGRRLTAGRRLDDAALQSLALRLADVLCAVHAAAIIHRDIKPTNIFYAQDRARGYECVKLLDFGIAKLLQLSPLTTLGTGHGTPAYMAPEYLADPDRLDPRADLYALGVVLYQCATGKLPYDTDNEVELMMRHQAGRVPDVLQSRPELPKHLAAVITRCLQCDPEARYPDATSVYVALSIQP